MAPRYLVVAGRVHLAPAEPDEVGVAAAEPYEVGVDATADGRGRVPALGRRGRRRRRGRGRGRQLQRRQARPAAVERAAETHKVLVHSAAPGQRVHRPDGEPLVHGRRVEQRGQRQRRRQQTLQQQQHHVTCAGTERETEKKKN